MNLSTIHRGPDGSGVYINKDNSICLGMNRLAILGLETGSQPMFTNNKRKILVFNGEIFNFSSLSNEYLNKKYNSDTKTLLELLNKYGIKCLDLINGMFSFAFYDLEKNKLYIVRDRFGIKPLYYHFKNDFIFSSEIKSIQKVLKNSSRINYKNISNYLTLNHSHGNETTFTDIKKIPPGFYIEYDFKKKKIILRKWYDINIKQKKFNNNNEYIEETYSQIKKSIKLWTKSDVPISFLLSGGMDSGLLAKSFSDISPYKINTISLAFSQKKEKKWNEISTIKALTKKIRSNHKTIFFNPKNFLDDFEDITSSLDEPYGGGLPSWFVFKQISKKYKVAISGTGGDEIFGNYNRFFRYCNIKIKPEKLKFYRYFYNLYRSDNIWKKKYTNLKLEHETSDLVYEKLKKINYNSSSKNFSLLDIKTQLADEFLYITDLFSMKHSLEVRTPYLDHNLVELVYSYPEKYRISKNIYKPLLRNIGKKILPKEYIFQEKKGFSLPLSHYMRGILKPYIIKYFSKEKINQINIMKYSFVEDYIKPMLNGDNANIQLIWNVLILQIWAEKKFK